MWGLLAGCGLYVAESLPGMQRKEWSFIAGAAIVHVIKTLPSKQCSFSSRAPPANSAASGWWSSTLRKSLALLGPLWSHNWTKRRWRRSPSSEVTNGRQGSWLNHRFAMFLSSCKAYVRCLLDLVDAEQLRGARDFRIVLRGYYWECYLLDVLFHVLKMSSSPFCRALWRCILFCHAPPLSLFFPPLSLSLSLSLFSLFSFLFFSLLFLFSLLPSSSLFLPLPPSPLLPGVGCTCRHAQLVAKSHHNRGFQQYHTIPFMVVDFNGRTDFKCRRGQLWRVEVSGPPSPRIPRPAMFGGKCMCDNKALSLEGPIPWEWLNLIEQNQERRGSKKHEQQWRIRLPVIGLSAWDDLLKYPL